MHFRIPASVAFALILTGLTTSTAKAAEEYALDGAHTAVYFRISHGGFSETYGRFNNVGGTLSVDKEAANSSLEVTIKTDSIDTGNAKRDEHLRAPDFLNAKQFPAITFKSTSVSSSAEGQLEVKGDFTMHGVTKPITLKLTGGKVGEFPKGVTRTGYSTHVDLKRSDFGMDKFVGMIGDEVHIAISFEATKKK